jgi:hypothetical protein
MRRSRATKRCASRPECMRWVPRGVAALGRSGQPLEQPASASWSVTKPSQPPRMIATDAWTSQAPKASSPRIRQPNSRASQGSRLRPRAVISSSSGGGGWSAWSRKGFTLLPHRLTEVARRLQQSAVRRPRIDPAPRRDLSRSSRRRTRRRHHGRARRGRACGRRRNGHGSRARAVLRRGLSAEWQYMEPPAVPPAVP